MDSTTTEDRSLVMCCDGTGNVWSHERGATNIVKLFTRLDLSPVARQLAYYDPGVGSTGDRAEETSQLFDQLIRVAGLAWGRGVWRNVAEAYIWLMRHYQPGDRLFLFGFSRGAFTARAVSGLLHNYGLLRPEHENLLPSLLQNYRLPPNRRDPFRKSIRERFSRNPDDASPFPIHFIGMFDTVESVGLNDIFLGQSITSDTNVKPGFLKVRHALAIDELRWPYAPRSYLPAPSDETGEQLKEVWFSGAHCDVGGGYNPSGLSDLSLWWMLEEAEDAGLKLRRNPHEAGESNCWRAGLFPNPFQPAQSEPRSTPIWSLLGLVRRPQPAAHALIHQSVQERCEADADYASKLGQWLKSHRLMPNSNSLTTHLENRRQQLRTAKAPALSRKKLDLARALIGLAALLILVGWALSMKQQLAMLGAQMTAGAGLAQHLLQLQLPVGTLLWWDTLAIIVYTAILARAKSALVHFAERRHALPAWASQNLPRVIAGIYVSDLVENLGTGLSLAMAGEASVIGLPGPIFVGGFGVLALIACWIKLASIGLSLMFVPYLFAQGLRRPNTLVANSTQIENTAEPGANP